MLLMQFSAYSKAERGLVSMPSTGKLSKSLFSLVALLWPLLIWFGVIKHTIHWLTPVLIGLMVIRLIAFLPDGGPLREVVKAGSVLAILLCSMSVLFQRHEWLLWYPVAMTSVMLIFFGHSLVRGTPVIEQLARISRPELPSSAIRYTRSVTKVWCAFFVINGLISVATIYIGNMAWWGLWNGLISYLLMGLLLVGEWLIRRRIAR